jgi:hypothetical protein
MCTPYILSGIILPMASHPVIQSSSSQEAMRCDPTLQEHIRRIANLATHLRLWIRPEKVSAHRRFGFHLQCKLTILSSNPSRIAFHSYFYSLLISKDLYCRNNLSTREGSEYYIPYCHTLRIGNKLYSCSQSLRTSYGAPDTS